MATADDRLAFHCGECFAEFLLLQPEDVTSIVSSKLAKRYAGPDVDAMKAVATAHENRSLEEYQEALRAHKARE